MGYRSMKRFFNAITLNFIFIPSIQASLLEDLPEIEYESFKLENGLTVIVHQDKKVPMVAVNVWYHVGSKNEKVGKTGLEKTFENQHIFKPGPPKGPRALAWPPKGSGPPPRVLLGPWPRPKRLGYEL